MKRETQRESGVFTYLKALFTERLGVRSLLYYVNPPAIFEEDELVTKYYVDQVTGQAGGKRISIPSTDYPDATITDDGFSVTVTFGTDLSALLAGFEPVAFLINDGLVSDVTPRYIYDGSGAVTGMLWDGGYVPFSVRKVNFVA